MNPATHLTTTNTRTPTHPCHVLRYPTATLTLAWLLSLLLLLAASQRGTFLVPPASSVYHTMADGKNTRYRCHYANNGYVPSTLASALFAE